MDPARDVPDGLDPAVRESLRGASAGDVADEIRPAFARYRAYLAR